MKVESKNIGAQWKFGRIVASLLLAVLTVTIVGQSLHVHTHNLDKGDVRCNGADHNHDKNNSSNRDDQSCLLCQFTLSVFIETELIATAKPFAASTPIHARYILHEIITFPLLKLGRSPPILVC